MIRLKDWLGLRQGFEDLARRGNVFNFVLRLMFLSISLALMLQLLAIPVCRALGLLDMPLGEAFKLGVAMSWLICGFVSAVVGAGVGSQVRSLAVAKARYEHLSRVDGLTGLLNRRAFSEVLDETRGQASLAIIDLDHFKSVNDCHGHGAGDFVIRAVSAVLEELCRAGHVCARLGGEEFGVLLHGGARKERLQVIEAVRNRVASLPLHYDNQSIGVTISAGVAEFEKDRRMESVYAAADRALYRAKAAGRNLVVHEDDVKEWPCRAQAGR
ncbi:GGDEF domain-containing protein [Allorhizobium undicola]|uniref:GGDEF domain-containing protein n=1 Tax=Allorhizobium undicola TaxID=78527 RepID=UPI001AEC25AC|nr:GGDEF domain-containing protein [Allorhizobium undicola]